jgi:hypothetical protein
VKFGNVPTYNVPQLERMALELLEKSLGKHFAIPVDVELAVDRQEGVKLDLWPGLRDNHQIEGMVCVDEDTHVIWVFIDEVLADRFANRYRSTVAEELGHIALHRQAIEQVRTPEDFLELQRHPSWQQMERNAKRFGAAALMPGDRLLACARDVYPKMVAIAGFLNQEAIINQLATVLAGRFEVSPQSMRYRFGEYPARVEDKIKEAMQERLNFI